MTPTYSVVLAAAALATSTAIHAERSAQTSAPDMPAAVQTQPREDRAEPASEAEILVDFEKRVQAYMKLHREMAQQVPKVSAKASMEEIDRSQRLLLQRLAAARADVGRGALFTPHMEALVRRVLVQLFEKADGRQLRDSIMDENPTGLTLRVNDRYPDTVPMATMPPALLAALPPLPEELEYRFVGEDLVIVDVPAHLIVDFIPGALPK